MESDLASAAIELGVGVDVCWPYRTQEKGSFLKHRRFHDAADLLAQPDLGEPALDYLTEIVHRRPKDWIWDVDHLHDLLQLYGPDRLRSAFEHGLSIQVFGARHIERALQLPSALFAGALIQ